MKKIAVIILLSLIYTTIFAQNIDDGLQLGKDEMGIGTRAAGMGNAMTAIANDFSAIYWNPAGLALAATSSLYFEAQTSHFQNKATFYSNTINGNKTFVNLKSLGLVIKLPTIRGSASLALGYQRVNNFHYILNFAGKNPLSNGLGFDLDDGNGNISTYPFDSNVYQEEKIFNKGGMGLYSIGGGMALSPHFYGGITLDFWKGNSNYSQQFIQTDIDNLYNMFPGDFYSYTNNRYLKQKFSGFGIRLSALLELSPVFKLGFMYGSPVSFSVKEVFNENDVLLFDDNYADAYDYGTNEYSYDIKMPYFIDFGAAFQTKSATIAASFRYRDWSTMEFDNPALPEDLPYFQNLNTDIQNQLRATIEQRFGGEIFLSPLHARLRGGIIIKPSPYKNSNEDPVIYYTFGLGYSLDKYISLNFAGMYNTRAQVSEDEFTPGGTNEDITKIQFTLGLNYRF